jgi:hypothetical protein
LRPKRIGTVNRIGGTQRAGIFCRFNRRAAAGGRAAKQKEGSTQAASDAGTNAAGPPVSPNNVDRARDEYDRAVIDYQNCLLDNTANLSACERQRAAMKCRRDHIVWAAEQEKRA